MNDGVFERSPRTALPPVGPAPGEQLVQHDSERIHIGRNAERLACDLLGRGVLRRERAAGYLAEHGLLGQALVQQLGDAEVQQPHLALGGHQDVGRLHVAMHDQLAVRIRDRLGHLQKRAKPRGHVEAVVVAVPDRWGGLRRTRAPDMAARRA